MNFGTSKRRNECAPRWMNEQANGWMTMCTNGWMAAVKNKRFTRRTDWVTEGSMDWKRTKGGKKMDTAITSTLPRQLRSNGKCFLSNSDRKLDNSDTIRELQEIQFG